MENLTYDDEFNQNIILNSQMKTFLKETAKWARFIAIVGFIGLGFMVVMSFSIGAIMSTVAPVPQSDFPFPPFLLTFIYLAFSLIGFFPLLYLFRFSTKTLQSIRSNNEALMTHAFENLKSHYKFYGILLIIILAIYVLLFLLVFIAGGAGMLMQ